MKDSYLLVGIIAVMSCRMTPSPLPVPVQGSHRDVSTLSGDWSGSYSSKTTGRRGTIRFSLRDHADTGFGEVEITFSPALRLGREASSVDYPKGHEDELVPETCMVMGITVVRIEDDLVRGKMAPYWDPDCDCRAQTVFEGKLARNRITGSFNTRRESTDRRVLTGQWRVDRER
jgi:hypothetical protein